MEFSIELSEIELGLGAFNLFSPLPLPSLSSKLKMRKLLLFICCLMIASTALRLNKKKGNAFEKPPTENSHRDEASARRLDENCRIEWSCIWIEPPPTGGEPEEICDFQYVCD